MRQWRQRLGLWLARWAGWQPPAPILVHDWPPMNPEVASGARRLVQEADALAADGEYKRHQVYAKLIKRFPDQAKADLAYTIERVIQERRTHG